MTSQAISDFGIWWVETLRSFFPASKRAQIASAPISMSTGSVGKNNAVQLSPEQYVLRTVSKQRMRHSYAISMMQIDLATNTPFDAADVHQFGPFQENNGVSYAIVWRSILTELLDQLSPRKRKGVWLQFGDDGPIARLSEDGAKTGFKIRSKLWLAGVASLVIVALGTATHAHWRNANAISTVEAQIQALEPQVAEMRKIMSERRDRIARSETLRTHDTAMPAVVSIWEELTRALPDNSHLTALNLRNSNIEIEGFAQNAADLLPRLEETRLFSAIKSNGPIVSIPGREQQRFTLSMQVEP